jgi:hypothetical protein
MTTETKPVNVRSALAYASAAMACAPEIPGYNGTLFAISEETRDRIESDLDDAIGALAELIDAAESAYPPGDYSQDAHGFAVRAALARIGGDA